MPGSDNYFHWLFDTLPRLRLLEASGFGWDRIVVPRRTRFQRDGAALIGIDETRIIDAPDAQIEAAQLIVPGLPGVSGNPPGWACAFLRERFLPHVRGAPTGTRKIYVSRRQSGTRKVLNEDELLAALAADGFELFFLEDLAFIDQVRLFHSAHTVVSAHGSGLSNLVFCPPGAGVVELFSPAYVNVCYWALANQVGLAYRYVLGEGAAGTRLGPGPGLVHENMRLDVAKVQAVLRSLG
jgi:capsular polysaccharide biosynthesis protein